MPGRPVPDDDQVLCLVGPSGRLAGPWSLGVVRVARAAPLVAWSWCGWAVAFLGEM